MDQEKIWEHQVNLRTGKKVSVKKKAEEQRAKPRKAEGSFGSLKRRCWHLHQVVHKVLVKEWSVGWKPDHSG